MVGRMRANHLVINGGDSAKEWKELAEPACTAARVDCTISGSGYGPSDHMPFYIAGIPVLFMFTGNHLDYHTATDDSDKINAAGGSRVAMIAADLAKRVANRAGGLTYVKAPPEHQFGDVRHIGASLGTIPSYSEDPNQLPGLVLSDVRPDGPAAKAGLKGGDRIIKVGEVEIRGIEDLMFVLQAAKPGTATKITFVRTGKTQTVDATFGVPTGRR
jgi:membrane-associated protease RseP (regulator of RpoE activity)